jgi:hypothetical protein
MDLLIFVGERYTVISILLSATSKIIRSAYCI